MSNIVYVKKTYLGTYLCSLTEALLMSTHNICFCEEIRKIFTWYPLLSRPMLYSGIPHLNILHYSGITHLNILHYSGIPHLNILHYSGITHLNILHYSGIPHLNILHYSGIPHLHILHYSGITHLKIVTTFSPDRDVISSGPYINLAVRTCGLSSSTITSLPLWLGWRFWKWKPEIFFVRKQNW